MPSDLSKFAARLRAFIRLFSDEPAGCRGENGLLATGAHGAIFNDLALALFALQFAANAPYRKLCEVRGIRPTSIAHWKEIPAVPTAAFKELEMTSLAPAERTHVFHSSGTTAQSPSRHFHNAESLAVYEASLWPWFCSQILRETESATGQWSLAILTPPPAQAPHSSLVHMLDIVRRKLGAKEDAFLGQVAANGAWTVDVETAIARLKDQDARLLVLGTAFSFVHLLDVLGEKRLAFKLPAGSRVMETGGYKGRSRSLPKRELHALVAECLGVLSSEIICEYGMSELSSQAYDQVLDATRNTQHATRPLHFPPWTRAQIISPETGHEVRDGETGLIRVCDLANVFSVMAVQTEDLAVRRGDEFELIGRTELAEPRGCSLMAV